MLLFETFGVSESKSIQLQEYIAQFKINSDYLEIWQFLIY